MSYFSDVGAFHARFGLPKASDGPPALLDGDVFAYRFKFLLEELAEYAEAQGMPAVAYATRSLRAKVESLVPAHPGPTNLAESLDALVDLTYVALGTAHLSFLPFDEGWREVQRANLTKERGPTAQRGHHLDVRKPEGWRAPRHEQALAVATGRHSSGVGWQLPLGLECDCPHRVGDRCCGGLGDLSERAVG